MHACAEWFVTRTSARAQAVTCACDTFVRRTAQNLETNFSRWRADALARRLRPLPADDAAACSPPGFVVAASYAGTAAARFARASEGVTVGAVVAQPADGRAAVRGRDHRIG